MEIATNSQETFVRRYALSKLQKEELGIKTEKEGPGPGVRRSNTREDGRRNGVVLRVVNPAPSPESKPSSIQQEKFEPVHRQQSFETRQENRAKFEAFKKARGIHGIEAATLYHHQAFLASANNPPSASQPLTRSKPSQPQSSKGNNQESLGQEVKRARSKFDAWKSGAVEPEEVPKLNIIASMPRDGDGSMQQEMEVRLRKKEVWKRRRGLRDRGDMLLKRWRGRREQGEVGRRRLTR